MKIDMKKILSYKPPILVSLLIIIIVFIILFLLTNNRNSYAVVNSENKLTKSFELTSTNSDVYSDGNNIEKIKTRTFYDNNRQVFLYSINSNYGNNYIKENRITDEGLLYILLNSYPNIDIKDGSGVSLDGDFQTWITQVSIWLYLYEKELSINGTVSSDNPSYLDSSTIYSIKNSNKLISSSSSLDLGNNTIYNKYIKILVDNALSIDSVSNNLYVSLEDNNVYMTKDNKYYQSSLITVTSNNSEYFKGYKVLLDNLPKGTKIVDEDGRVINIKKDLNVVDKFYVRVPKKSIKHNDIITIKVRGIFKDIDVYLYKSDGYNNIINYRLINDSIVKKIDIKF